MNNKILAGIVVILVPFTINSFLNKETIFNEEKINEQAIVVEPIIKVQKGSETLSLSLEEYVIGVVAGEMPASFQEEALKAQAVASRTFALNRLKNKDVLSSTTGDQVYITDEEMRNKWGTDYDKYYTKIKECVLKTKGETLTYNDEIISAYYFSMSNGHTENALTVFNEDKPYLISVESNWEVDNQNYEKELQISQQDFCKTLGVDCNTIEISNIERNDTGHVDNIEVNNTTFTGTEFRHLLGLRSTDFDITITDQSIIITTRGYGHGVGMSQYGANEMAKLGYSYDEILKYYYKNIELTNY